MGAGRQSVWSFLVVAAVLAPLGPAGAEENCAATISADCLKRMNAGAATLAPDARCERERDAYRECLRRAIGGDAAAGPKGAAADGCLVVSGPLEAAISVKVGDVLCDPEDPSRRAVFKRIEGRGAIYVNGPFGDTRCLHGEKCGVHWARGSAFRVQTRDRPKGEALLRPPGR